MGTLKGLQLKGSAANKLDNKFEVALNMRWSNSRDSNTRA